MSMPRRSRASQRAPRISEVPIHQPGHAASRANPSSMVTRGITEVTVPGPCHTNASKIELFGQKACRRLPLSGNAATALRSMPARRPLPRNRLVYRRPATCNAVDDFHAPSALLLMIRRARAAPGQMGEGSKRLRGVVDVVVSMILPLSPTKRRRPAARSTNRGSSGCRRPPDQPRPQCDRRERASLAASTAFCDQFVAVAPSGVRHRAPCRRCR